MKKILQILGLIFIVLLLTSGMYLMNNNIFISSNGVVRIGNAINNVSLDDTTAIRLNGYTTVWDDLMFPFTTAKTGVNDYPAFNQDSMYYSFAVDSVGATRNIMFFIVQLPHSWKEGSTVYPHVHYKYESGVGVPVFIIKYKWYEIGATTQFGWSWLKLNTNSGTTDKTHQMVSNATGIEGTNKTLSSILVVQLYLFSRSGTGNVNAWQFDIHYERDAMGSKEILIK